ncbi:MAG: DUF4142 domain-containing protein [Pseudomonadota bacterium]
MLLSKKITVHSFSFKKLVLASSAALALLITQSTAWADIPAADKDFILKAADAGTTEVTASTQAQLKSKSSEIKAFADAMVKDHTAVDEELKKIATTKGISVPVAPSTKHQSKIDKLNTLQDAKYDQKYVEEIGVAAHKDAVALFKKAEKDVKDPELKAFITKTLPSLEHHLKMAEDLKNKISKAQ